MALHHARQCHMNSELSCHNYARDGAVDRIELRAEHPGCQIEALLGNNTFYVFGGFNDFHTNEHFGGI